MEKYNWDFIATEEKQDAYASIIDKLNPCSSEEFKTLSEEQQDMLLNNMIKEIRKINVFPIYYFNKKGIAKEIKAAMDKKVCFIDNNLDISYAQGLLLLDFLFPNLHHVHAGDIQNLTVYDRFYNDDTLKACLKMSLKNRKIINMRTAFFAPSRFLWRSAINYSPMRAKAIYERFCPKNGVIYDYSAGFGGRMLGALSSSNNFTYIGTDPNSETYEHLNELGGYIEEISKRKNSYVLYNKCSEDLHLEKESIDFIFSCPPFFNLETYSEEETQSIQKFPKYEDWLEKYVRPTVKNCVEALKTNGLYGVNIVNFWKGGKKYLVADDWVRIAKEEGLFLQGIFTISSKARKNKEDQDQIYIFSKDINIKIPNYTDKNAIIAWEQKIEEYEKKKEKNKYYIVQYDIFGNFIQKYNDYLEIKDFTKEEIKLAIKTKKNYKNYYFKTFKNNEEYPLLLEIKKPICLIDNLYFHSFAEAGRYLNTSRQCIAQAKNRKSKKIVGHEVQWF